MRSVYIRLTSGNDDDDVYTEFTEQTDSVMMSADLMMTSQKTTEPSTSQLSKHRYMCTLFISGNCSFISGNCL